MRSCERRRRPGATAALLLALALTLGASPGAVAAGRTVLGEMFGGSG